MSFYIGKYGHVFEYGGRASEKEPPIEATVLGFENTFEDKDRAFYFRDELRTYRPEVFNSQEQPAPEKEKSPSKKPMTQEDFREEMRKGVTQHINEFWMHLNQLSHKDFVEGWLKAASFGFSKAPTEKEMDEDEKQKQTEKENKRKQDLIRRGIKTEDMED